MPEPPSLESLLQRATLFPGLNIRVGSLDATRQVIERQLQNARLDEIRKVRETHKLLGDELHPDDADAENFDIEQQVLHLLPKALRGGFLVILWSVLERCVRDIASVAAQRRGAPSPEKVFRRYPFFKAADSALLAAAGVVAFPDAQVRGDLQRLQAVRHALVHNDGRQDAFPESIATMTPNELASLGLVLAKDFDFTYIVPSEDYVAAATALVYGVVHDLADRVFEAVVPR
jgi:hypothetical protein